MKSLNWLDRILLGVHLIISFLLILSSITSYIPPEKGGILFLLSMIYPGFLGLSFLFGLYWIFKFKWPILITVLSFALTYSNLENFFATNFSNPPVESPDFSVVTFNVRLFNQYKWIENENVSDSIFAYLENQSPDIVLFQEFINRDKNNYRFIEKMKDLGYPYYRVEPRGGAETINRFFGLATFSRYPIQNFGVAFPEHPPQWKKDKAASIFTDISIQGEIIRVYNTHLQSLKFGNEDYTFVENIGKNDDKETLEKTKGIASKILQAAYKRTLEVNAIVKHIDLCPYPVIIAGDFNDPPFSYSYHTISKNLNDGFIARGFGWGTTFDGLRTIPGLRLDYVLYSDNLEINTFEIGPKLLSDHRPIFTTFSVPK